MGASFPKIPADAPATLARDLLDTNESVSISESQIDLPDLEGKPYVGILTPSDSTRIEEI